MSAPGDALLKRLLEAFRPEAEERLSAMSARLLEWEQLPAGAPAQALIELIYREAHSLKGAARTVNIAPVEMVCQSLETLLAALKHGRIAVSPALFDHLHRSLDLVGYYLLAADSAEPGPAPWALPELLGQLAALAGGAASAPVLRPGPPAGPVVQPAPEASIVAAPAGLPEPGLAARAGGPETVRIRASKLDAILLQLEEMLAVKLRAAQRAADLRATMALMDRWQKEWRHVAPELRQLLQAPAPGPQEALRRDRVREFLDGMPGRWRGLDAALSSVTRAAERDGRSVASLVDTLLGEVKKAVMLPFSSVLEIFPKLVRDLARDQGKDIRVAVQGGEFEIDKRILEEIRDPLIHLVRNSAGHGIELPAERARRGKAAQGVVTIAVSRIEGDKIEIQVADDGAGIDVQRVKAAALQRGLVSADQARSLSGAAAADLVFLSELSTSPVITALSGRGLGLAIVRERLGRLGGFVSVASQPGAGTVFRLVLPVTLSTFRGILVRAAGQVFVVPTAHVARAVRFNPEEVRSVENRETILFENRTLALARLEDVLGLPQPAGSPEAPARGFALIVSGGGQLLALGVDAVLHEQEILVKRFAKPLGRVPNIAGAAVLGDGRVVPILSVPDLMKSARQSSGRGARPAPAAPARPRRKSVLVAEDSITSRLLLQTVLESAGYAVETAVDGAEGWAKLKTGAYDLLVSDVEMPRMDGFALTRAVRQDAALADLPVVLVTSLETREDREQGADAGASAYIVKSSFDQTALLEIIRRLL